MIHGRDDLLLKVEGGFDLGRIIPDAELHIYPGMGHEFPRPLWDEFIDIILRTTQRGFLSARGLFHGRGREGRSLALLGATPRRTSAVADRKLRSSWSSRVKRRIDPVHLSVR